MAKQEKKQLDERIIIGIGAAIFVISLMTTGKISRSVATGAIEASSVSGVNGLISQLQVLISVGMVVLAPKKGVWGSIILNAINTLYVLGFGVLLSHSKSALPGAVSPLITIIICYTIHDYAKKAVEANRELQKTNKDLIKTNAAIVEEGEKLSQMVYTDDLTGLSNRSQFVKEVDEMIALQPTAPFLVIFANVDDFAEINKKYGEEMGDVVLGIMAYRLRNFCSQKDTVCRIGGDEFAVIMRGKRPKDAVKSIIKDLSAEVCEPINSNGRTLESSMSFGVVFYSANGRSAEALLNNGHAAVQKAKNNGKNQIVFFDEM